MTTTTVFLQWKNTDTCLDLHCECGRPSHFDGYFAYGIKCVHCGRVYTIPYIVAPQEGPPENGLVQETSRPDREVIAFAVTEDDDVD